jgi:RNA polymerase sigma-70 factor (ECF subfamily)
VIPDAIPVSAESSVQRPTAGAADFDAFFRAQYQPIVRITWSLTGRLALAEELAQEVFLVAHRQWARISNYDDPPAWLRRVAINRALSALRRRAVESRGLARAAGLGGGPPDEAELPAAAAEVWRALRALPRRQAEVLVLVIVEDRAVADVARILNCSEHTVRTHLRRGRSKMAEMLGAEER